MNGYKTLIGAVVALAAELARLYGLELGDQEGIVNSIIVIGGLVVVVYGRVVATRDLRRLPAGRHGRAPLSSSEISDGFHTFAELYRYRMAYNAAFFNMLPVDFRAHKSKRHNDGELCFGGGWFVVVAHLPTGQISNHYAIEHWDLFRIPERHIADKWDGHTPDDAADRLEKYLRCASGALVGAPLE